MEIKYYLDGKCIFSYDDEVFSSEEDYTNIMELFIDPIRDEVYKKYYQKQLFQQIFDNVFKENDTVFHAYCDIKHLIEGEYIWAEDIKDDDTLLKRLMREKLNFHEFEIFETLLNKAGDVALDEEERILLNRYSMTEHFWVEKGTDKK